MTAQHAQLDTISKEKLVKLHVLPVAVVNTISSIIYVYFLVRLTILAVIVMKIVPLVMVPRRINVLVVLRD